MSPSHSRSRRKGRLLLGLGGVVLAAIVLAACSGGEDEDEAYSYSDLSGMQAQLYSMDHSIDLAKNLSYSVTFSYNRAGVSSSARYGWDGTRMWFAYEANGLHEVVNNTTNYYCKGASSATASAPSCVAVSNVGRVSSGTLWESPQWAVDEVQFAIAALTTGASGDRISTSVRTVYNYPSYCVHIDKNSHLSDLCVSKGPSYPGVPTYIASGSGSSLVSLQAVYISVPAASEFGNPLATGTTAPPSSSTPGSTNSTSSNPTSTNSTPSTPGSTNSTPSNP